MAGDDVTVQGVVGARPGRDAPTGVHGRRPDGDGHRRRRGGEERMVPDARPTSYYGLPVLNRPTWEARDIAGYLFLGGLAGASSVLGALAGATGRPVTARASKLTAVGAAGLSAVALIHDLGRPERFANMLRVFKPTSPMSVGSWLLAGFGPLAGGAALSDLTGRAPRCGAAASAAAAALGAGVA
ncbi:MAG: polysulfide reductase, partial [Acidimicrobiales bacterium]|nr:polysulfide reductase [Acidimicrobiales bacterium]